jgi:hypothetical protein
MPGTYRCECKPGYNLFGGQGMPGFCFPKDMCGEDNGGCEGPCYSKNGEKVCTCQLGLELAADGKHCQDIDECATGAHKCEQTCVNKDPRETGLDYTCECGAGYAVDYRDTYRCVKADEFFSKLGFQMHAVAANMGYGTIVGVIAVATLTAVLAGVAVQRFRMRRVMQDEIHSIMRQYMPLEAENNGMESLLDTGNGSGEDSARIGAFKNKANAQNMGRADSAFHSDSSV